MNARRRYESAQRHCRTGELASARRELDTLIAAGSRVAAVFSLRGQVRVQAKDPLGAVADFDQAIALAPQRASGYLKRGWVRLDLGAVDAARQDFERALQLDPEAAQGWHGIGVVQRLLGDLAGAESCYGRALELVPDAEGIRCNRARLRFDRGDQTGAFADLDHVLAVNQDCVDALVLRGGYRAGPGFGPVPADLDRAVALQPDDAVVRTARARARHVGEDFLGAITDCDRAIAIDPHYHLAWFYRGLARDDAGDVDGAVADLQHAIALGPHVASFRVALARILLAADRAAAALPGLHEAVGAFPDDPGLLRLRVAVHRDLGEHAAADADWRAAGSQRAGEAMLGSVRPAP